MQKEVAEFVKENHLKTEIGFRMLDLVSEVGELSKEVLKGQITGNTDLLQVKVGQVSWAMCCFH